MSNFCSITYLRRACGAVGLVATDQQRDGDPGARDGGGEGRQFPEAHRVEGQRRQQAREVRQQHDRRDLRPSITNVVRSFERRQVLIVRRGSPGRT